MKKKETIKMDLEKYFTHGKIGKITLDTLSIGKINLPTGNIICCDPFVDIEDAGTFIQKVPKGEYPVTLCISSCDEWEDRYACVKLTITDNVPVRYEPALTKYDTNDCFGFFVDAGMGCIIDEQARKKFSDYLASIESDDDFISIYDSIFSDLLEENAKINSKYQRSYGDWLNFTIPNSKENMTIFTSGFGDGLYPCYFGYDKSNEISGLYILFIDLEDQN